MPGFVFEKGTYIGGGKKNVFADIFDRKCLIHVMFSDVAFDHMDGWILMCLISRMFQKVFRLPAKSLMKLGKSKTSLNDLCNGFCVHIVCLQVLFPGFIKSQEQFIIEILYSILEHFCIFSKIFLKLIQKNKGRFGKPGRK